MSMIKDKYEISIWKDFLVPGYEDDQGRYILEHYEEKKIAIIGADDMDSPFAAKNPQLTKNVNGKTTLKFDMYYRCFDERSGYDGDFKENPFLVLLADEAKVKIKFRDKWYDCIIKKCEEKSENYTFSYTLDDIYTNELVRNGFKTELDVELENNQGNVCDLAELVLEDSDWLVDRDLSETIVETKIDPIYKCKLNSTIEVELLSDYLPDPEEAKNQEIVSLIKEGDEIYFFYSEMLDEKEHPTILYAIPPKTGEKRYKTDENNDIIINAYNYRVLSDVEYGNTADNTDAALIAEAKVDLSNKKISGEDAKNYIEFDEDYKCFVFKNDEDTIKKMEGSTILDELSDYIDELNDFIISPEVTFAEEYVPSITDMAVIETDYRGKKVIRSPKTGYDPDVDKFITHYVRTNDWLNQLENLLDRLEELIEDDDGDYYIDSNGLVQDYKKDSGITSQRYSKVTHYGYVHTEDYSPYLAVNYLANSTDFISTDTGWYFDGTPTTEDDVGSGLVIDSEDATYGGQIYLLNKENFLTNKSLESASRPVLEMRITDKEEKYYYKNAKGSFYRLHFKKTQKENVEKKATIYKEWDDSTDSKYSYAYINYDSILIGVERNATWLTLKSRRDAGEEQYAECTDKELLDYARNMIDNGRYECRTKSAVNTGPSVNRSDIGSITEGEEYVLALSLGQYEVDVDEIPRYYDEVEASRVSEIEYGNNFPDTYYSFIAEDSENNETELIQQSIVNLDKQVQTSPEYFRDERWSSNGSKYNAAYDTAYDNKMDLYRSIYLKKGLLNDWIVNDQIRRKWDNGTLLYRIAYRRALAITLADSKILEELKKCINSDYKFDITHIKDKISKADITLDDNDEDVAYEIETEIWKIVRDKMKVPKGEIKATLSRFGDVLSGLPFMWKEFGNDTTITSTDFKQVEDLARMDTEYKVVCANLDKDSYIQMNMPKFDEYGKAILEDYVEQIDEEGFTLFSNETKQFKNSEEYEWIRTSDGLSNNICNNYQDEYLRLQVANAINLIKTNDEPTEKDFRKITRKVDRYFLAMTTSPATEYLKKYRWCYSPPNIVLSGGGLKYQQWKNYSTIYAEKYANKLANKSLIEDFHHYYDGEFHQTPPLLEETDDYGNYIYDTDSNYMKKLVELIKKIDPKDFLNGIIIIDEKAYTIDYGTLIRFGDNKEFGIGAEYLFYCYQEYFSLQEENLEDGYTFVLDEDSYTLYIETEEKAESYETEESKEKIETGPQAYTDMFIKQSGDDYLGNAEEYIRNEHYVIDGDQMRLFDRDIDLLPDLYVPYVDSNGDYVFQSATAVYNNGVLTTTPACYRKYDEDSDKIEHKAQLFDGRIGSYTEIPTRYSFERVFLKDPEEGRLFLTSEIRGLEGEQYTQFVQDDDGEWVRAEDIKKSLILAVINFIFNREEDGTFKIDPTSELTTDEESWLRQFVNRIDTITNSAASGKENNIVSGIEKTEEFFEKISESIWDKEKIDQFKKKWDSKIDKIIEITGWKLNDLKFSQNNAAIEPRETAESLETSEEPLLTMTLSTNDWDLKDYIEDRINNLINKTGLAISKISEKFSGSGSEVIDKLFGGIINNDESIIQDLFSSVIAKFDVLFDNFIDTLRNGFNENILTPLFNAIFSEDAEGERKPFSKFIDSITKETFGNAIEKLRAFFSLIKDYGLSALNTKIKKYSEGSGISDDNSLENISDFIAISRTENGLIYFFPYHYDGVKIYESFTNSSGYFQSSFIDEDDHYINLANSGIHYGFIRFKPWYFRHWKKQRWSMIPHVCVFYEGASDVDDTFHIYNNIKDAKPETYIKVTKAQLEKKEEDEGRTIIPILAKDNKLKGYRTIQGKDYEPNHYELATKMYSGNGVAHYKFKGGVTELDGWKSLTNFGYQLHEWLDGKYTWYSKTYNAGDPYLQLINNIFTSKLGDYTYQNLLDRFINEGETFLLEDKSARAGASKPEFAFFCATAKHFELTLKDYIFNHELTIFEKNIMPSGRTIFSDIPLQPIQCQKDIDDIKDEFGDDAKEFTIMVLTYDYVIDVGKGKSGQYKFNSYPQNYYSKYTRKGIYATKLGQKVLSENIPTYHFELSDNNYPGVNKYGVKDWNYADDFIYLKGESEQHNVVTMGDIYVPYDLDRYGGRKRYKRVRDYNNGAYVYIDGKYITREYYYEKYLNRFKLDYRGLEVSFCDNYEYNADSFSLNFNIKKDGTERTYDPEEYMFFDCSKSPTGYYDVQIADATVTGTNEIRERWVYWKTAVNKSFSLTEDTLSSLAMVFQSNDSKENLNMDENNHRNYAFLGLQLFKYYPYKIDISDEDNLKKLNGFESTYTAKGMAIPGIVPVTNELTYTSTYIYNPDDVDDIESITYEYVGSEPETCFEIDYDKSCQKIRSISGKEKNYFTLLQDLCQEFNCWVDYHYNHNTNGQISYRLEEVYYEKEYIPTPDYGEYVPIFNEEEKEESAEIREQIEQNEFLISGFRAANETDSGRLKYMHITSPKMYVGRIPTEAWYDYVQVDEYDEYGDDYKESVINFKKRQRIKEFKTRYGLKDEDFFDKKYLTVPYKVISFHNYVGKPNYAGFKYGINLKSISRTLDSSNTTSKLIVKPNTNQYATDGFCSIQRAQDNPIGESVIYDFDWYIKNQMINYSELMDDLYTCSIDKVGYYTQLTQLNKNNRLYIQQIADLIVELDRIEADYKTAKLGEEAANEEIVKLVQLISAYEAEYGNLIDSPWTENKSKQYAQKVTQTVKGYTEEVSITGDNGEVIIYEVDVPTTNTLADYPKYNDQLRSLFDQMDIQQRSAKKFKQAKEVALALKLNRKKKYEELIKQQEDVAKRKTELNRWFYDKYSRFIQEGSWTDNDYMDDNLYYLDALSVLSNSRDPKVTYNVDVIDLQALEGYQELTFNVGDRTYVEDTEYFGYVKNTKKPYHEEIVVTEVTYNLDNPSKNSIKTQNYTTQFEDLFKRITSATATLKFNEGSYGASAEYVDFNGVADYDTLEEDMSNAILSKDSNVKTTTDGIEISDPNSSSVLKINSNGIYSSTDGGSKYQMILGANYVNSSMLSEGQIDTDRLVIGSSSIPNFVINRAGATAYKTQLDSESEKETVDYSTFVRFDQCGVYGIQNYFVSGKEIKDMSINDTFDSHGDSQKIKESKFSRFGLTWDGFFLKTGDSQGEGMIEIGTDSDLRMKVYDLDTAKWRDQLIIGKMKDLVDGNEYYGFRLIDEKGEVVMDTNQKGELYLKQKLRISNFSTNDIIPNCAITEESYQDPSDRVVLGIVETYKRNNLERTQNETSYSTVGKYVRQDAGDNYSSAEYLTKIMSVKVNDKVNFEQFTQEQIDYLIGNNETFAIFDNGNLYAKNAWIEGNIRANSGNIGDLIIKEGSLQSEEYEAGVKGFKLDKDGNLYANGAYIEGNIKATEGSIGQILIKDGSIQSANYIEKKSGFKLDKDGNLYANGAYINGEIAAFNYYTYITNPETQKLELNFNPISYVVPFRGGTLKYTLKDETFCIFNLINCFASRSLKDEREGKITGVLQGSCSFNMEDGLDYELRLPDLASVYDFDPVLYPVSYKIKSKGDWYFSHNGSTDEKKGTTITLIEKETNILDYFKIHAKAKTIAFKEVPVIGNLNFTYEYEVKKGYDFLLRKNVTTDQILIYPTGTVNKDSFKMKGPISYRLEAYYHEDTNPPVILIKIYSINFLSKSELYTFSYEADGTLYSFKIGVYCP